MASQIDPDVFPDNVKVDKAALRDQFEIAKNEISALQDSSLLSRIVAIDDDSFDNL